MSVVTQPQGFQPQGLVAQPPAGGVVTQPPAGPVLVTPPVAQIPKEPPQIPEAPPHEAPPVVSDWKPFSAHEVASWVKVEHRTPFLLVESMYSTPLQEKYGYKLVSASARVGVWRNPVGGYFVAFRGTTFFKQQSGQDLWDDFHIALDVQASSSISLVTEGRQVIDGLLKNGATDIMVGGHSLGGFAAMSIGTIYKLKTCSFNGAAPATNPVMVGPGTLLATHYHVCGDLISTHMSCQAADIVRVDKGYPFSPVGPHATTRFYEKDPTLRLTDATAEDVALSVWSAFIPATAPAFFMKAVVATSPIPCSNRSKNKLEQALVLFGSFLSLLIPSPRGFVLMPAAPSAISSDKNVYEIKPDLVK